VKSLIFLQGFALGGGPALPTSDRLAYLAIGIGLIILIGVLAYCVAKAVWPEEKW
jgi:hypothetical protein